MSHGEIKGHGIVLDCFDGPSDIKKEFDDLRKKMQEENAGKPDPLEDDEIRDFLSSPNDDPNADSGPPDVTVVPREEWSTIEPPDKCLQYTESLDYVLLTHTGTRTCSKSKDCISILRSLQRIHIALGYADIVYNFLIGGDGKVYEGRGWQWESAWLPKYYEGVERKALKIAQIGYYGDYSKKKVEPKLAKLQLDLIETGMYKSYVKWNATMIVDINEPDTMESL